MNVLANSEIKLLSSTNFFIGVVTSADAGTYTVQVAPKGQNNLSLVQGVPLASMFAANLGFKECLLPQPGSEVFCFSVDVGQCIIFGVIPQPDKTPDGGMMPARAVIGGGDSTYDSSNLQGYFGDGISKLKTFNATRPTDVRQGEYVLANEFGVMLGLFQAFATLKGSELAQVQTFFLDDLVRIISHNYQHYTSMGEVKIFHDGGTLQMEVGLSHDPKEALTGLPQVTSTDGVSPITDNKTPSKDDLNSFYSLSNDRLVGIERLKAFVGSLGDFINLLIVKPADGQLRALDGVAAKPDLGLSQVKVGLNGNIQVRSVSGITLEKTNWIRVPTRIRSPEDPEGNDPTTLPTSTPFVFNQELKYQDQPFMYFLQIRDYLSYVNEELGYRNFKALDKDFVVNDDYSKEDDLNTVTQVHPTHQVKYEKNNALISIMDNGGITLKDAWGSSIVMEGGNIYIHAAKDEIHQPMRNFIAKVGRSVSLAAQDEVDISSTAGGFRLKTDKAQYFYSDNSGILLHANGKDIFEVSPVNGAFTDVGGVILHAPNNTIVSHSKFKLDRVDETHSVHSNTLFIEADTELGIFSGNRIDLYSGGNFMVNATDLLSVVTEGSAFLFGETNTIVGMKDQTYGVTKFGLGFLPVEGLLDSQGIQSFKDYKAQISAIHAQAFSPTFQDDANFGNIEFQFLSTGIYGINSGLDYIPQTIVQQENDVFDMHTLRSWNEVAVNNTYPYPGADFTNCLVKSSLSNLQTVDGKLVSKTVGLTDQSTLTVGGNIFTDYKTL